MTLTDEELVARAKAGDLDCFNQLVLRWERPIYALAYRTLGREEEARDVVQEAFLRAYRGLRGFKGEAKFSSWLYRITLNLCRLFRCPKARIRWTWPTNTSSRPNQSRIWWRAVRCR
jgi:RNA polymerase sigma-70 factor (ECF subfamily)